MPAVIPVALAIGGTVVGGAVGTALTVASILASAYLGSRDARKAKQKARDDYNAQQVDRMANLVTTVGPRELVLGRVRKGGTVAFRGSTEQYNQHLMVHIALAAHEIDAIEGVYFNDQQVFWDPTTHEVTTAPYLRFAKASSASVVIPAGSTTATVGPIVVNGVVTATVAPVAEGEPATQIPATLSGTTVTIAPQSQATTISYQTTERLPRAYVWTDLGAPGATADPTTKLKFPTLWTDAHRGEGVAKLIVMFDYDDSAFPSGLPVVTAQIRGAKVYDPRTGLTAWSDNPALLTRHVYQHPKFGKATVTAAEDARFITAANACDTSQNYVVGGVTQTQKLYRANTVVPFGTPAASAMDDLAQAMAGAWAFAGGELYLRAGVYTAPVMTFTDADVAVVQRNGDQTSQDQLTIAVHRERADKFNVVNARIWDEQQEYKQVALTPLKGAALIARDGQELAQEVPLAAVSYAPQALHIAGVMMRDSRDPLTIEVPLTMRAYQVELFDVIQLALTRYGWGTTPKTFMVVSRVWDRDKGVIRIAGKETAAAIYTPDAAFQVQGYASNTALPSPWDIDPPGTLTISSGSSELLVGADGTIVTRVRVTWDPIADPRILLDGQVEVQWCTVSSGQWNSILVNGSTAEVIINGLSDGIAILVRARTRTSVASSDWGIQQLHIVLGKTEPPGVPTGVSITQQLVFFRPPADLDFAGVRIRALPGTVSAPVFSRGSDVIDGLVRTSPARIERRLFGVQTVMVIAEDTSGNQSAPAFATLDFGQPDVAGAVWTRVFANESFAGTAFGGCTIYPDAVRSDVNFSSDVYLLANIDGEPDVYATLYYGLLWQSDVCIIPYTGTVAVASTIAGNSVAVEYRISGDTITDIYAGADAYASADLYGTPTQWYAWPGALDVPRSTPLEFRVRSGSSFEQGVISAFTPTLILDVKTQTFSNVTLDAAGTRLTPSSGSPTRNWIGALRSIYGMPAADGSGAIAGRVLDYSTSLGPLVQFVDNTGTPVTARGTVTVEGFSDE